MTRQGEDMRRLMLGLGLDGGDGHVRITKGSNFHLFGGSDVTHGRMQETCIRFNEELRRRGKRLEDVDPQEAREIVQRISDKL